MSTTLHIDIKDQIGYIFLNRPNAYNAFNREMALALIDQIQSFSSDEEIRVVVIQGNGKAFCAGQDLVEVTADNGIGFEQILNEHYNPIIKAIRSCQKPVIAAVNGVAAGAGANIALACDFTIARDSAKFTQAFSKIGLVPDSGGTFFLPRLVGLQRATALMMLSDVISSTDAASMGMIYRSVSDDQFDAEVFNLSSKLAKLPTKALAMTKELLNASFTNSLHEQLEMEGIYQLKASSTEDYNEGVSAFLEKRKPNFKGK